MRSLVRVLLSALMIGGIAAAGAATPARAVVTADTVDTAVAVVTAVAPAIVAADTDDFSFDSWHSDLRLSLTADGHSALTTTETIVARFPDIDQNRGIRRAIPTHYDGHPSGLSLVSVTDENGRARAVETETTSEDGPEFLTVTSAANDFVHGPQTYVITYRQIDVTLVPDDANVDEFYWEVNGTGWSQPFGDVSATLTVDPELVPKLTGRAACYQGLTDSSTPCAALTRPATGAGLSVEAGALGPREGLTLAVAFEPGTFVPRDSSFTASPFPSIGLGGALVTLIGLLGASVLRSTRWRAAPGRPTIIAEYLPPKGVNLLQSGDVTATSAKAMAALFLSFAVRGNVRVLEGAGAKHYLLELRHADGLDAAESAVLARLFPGLAPGTRRDLKAKDAKLTAALQNELRGARKRMLTDGLRERKGGTARLVLIVLAVLAGCTAIAASLIALVTEIGSGWPALILVVGVLAATVTLLLVGSIRPLTSAGAELRDYLRGVKLYIGVAEAERLRVLQSPTGALRSPYRPDPVPVSVGAAARTAPGTAPGTADANRPLQVLKLYERLLPYAVLFGQEKQWSGVLGDYYARSDTQPDWYVGSGAFNAGYFAAGIGAFSSSTSTSWSGTASSSTSSGSGGGGSVGGGGGGGGGGGV